ncbi:MAG: type III pantothenate kinase [Gammaproteobacteria bacterium]|nr:type III pantothenate kinase [Gammaproteobacteria bacterium]
MAAVATDTRCLQLDVGNSSAKWRLVDAIKAGRVVARGRFIPGDTASEAQFIGSVATLSHIWIASVASAERDAALGKWLRESFQVEPWFAASEAATGELVNSYAEPQRMGVDRWLAMLGARTRSTGSLCVVDAGSALTIDVVAATGIHTGGYIIPGPSLMERALLLDTDRVRFEQDVDYALTPGRSTAEAVRHGIALAQVGAVERVLRQLGDAATSVFVTGGAGEQLLRLGNFEAELVPDLVLDGLAEMALLKH